MDNNSNNNDLNNNSDNNYQGYNSYNNYQNNNYQNSNLDNTYQNYNSYNNGNNNQYNNGLNQNNNYYNQNQSNNSYNNLYYKNTDYNINGKSYSTKTIDGIPPEVHKWNWGAFMLPIVWGIGNKSYLALLTLIPYVGFIFNFICGALGNKWAYDNTGIYYDSPEEFAKAQNSWNRAGIATFIISIVLILIFIFVIPLCFFYAKETGILHVPSYIK